ncbi:MAG: hypothetical protein WB660_20990 [Candidatus Sulfotelmatobacter sp.]
MAHRRIPPSCNVRFNEDWKQLYQYAILKPDFTKLLQRIAEARHAILDRAEEMMTNPPVTNLTN